MSNRVYVFEQSYKSKLDNTESHSVREVPYSSFNSFYTAVDLEGKFFMQDLYNGAFTHFKKYEGITIDKSVLDSVCTNGGEFCRGMSFRNTSESVVDGYCSDFLTIDLDGTNFSGYIILRILTRKDFEDLESSVRSSTNKTK